MILCSEVHPTLDSEHQDRPADFPFPKASMETAQTHLRLDLTVALQGFATTTLAY